MRARTRCAAKGSTSVEFLTPVLATVAAIADVPCISLDAAWAGINSLEHGAAAIGIGRNLPEGVGAVSLQLAGAREVSAKDDLRARLSSASGQDTQPSVRDQRQEQVAVVGPAGVDPVPPAVGGVLVRL